MTLDNPAWCRRQATGCTSGKGQLAPANTSRGCQVCTIGMLLLLLGQAKSPLLPLPQTPHPVEMVLPCLRLRPAVSHRAVATALLLVLDETMPTDKGVAAGVPVSSGKTRRVSSYFVYKPRLRPFDVCPQTESSCSANMACTTACVQLVSSVIQ